MIISHDCKQSTEWLYLSFFNQCSNCLIIIVYFVNCFRNFSKLFLSVNYFDPHNSPMGWAGQGLLIFVCKESEFQERGRACLGEESPVLQLSCPPVGPWSMQEQRGTKPNPSVL